MCLFPPVLFSCSSRYSCIPILYRVILLRGPYIYITNSVVFPQSLLLTTSLSWCTFSSKQTCLRLSWPFLCDPKKLTAVFWLGMEYEVLFCSNGNMSVAEENKTPPLWLHTNNPSRKWEVMDSSPIQYAAFSSGVERLFSWLLMFVSNLKINFISSSSLYRCLWRSILTFVNGSVIFISGDPCHIRELIL